MDGYGAGDGWGDFTGQIQSLLFNKQYFIMLSF